MPCPISCDSISPAGVSFTLAKQPTQACFCGFLFAILRVDCFSCLLAGHYSLGDTS